MCWGVEIWPCDAGVRLTPINSKQYLAKGCYLTLPRAPETLGEVAKALTKIAASLERRARIREGAQADHFSVLALYPETATGDYGGDYYFAHTQAPDAFDAARKVQQMASEANNGNIDADGFRPIAVFEGHVELALSTLDFGESLAKDTTEQDISETPHPPGAWQSTRTTDR